MSAPVAPWVLTGESIACLATTSRRLGAMPTGVHHMPGPCLIVATCFSGSPIGPYLELAVAEPARLGPRLGWCFTTMAVDSAEARVGGRDNWGFAKELARLRWTAYGDERELRWMERDVVVRGVPLNLPALPFLLPVRALGRRTDGLVVVPTRLTGIGRPARVTISASADDPLFPIAGRHPGIVVSSLRYLVKPARRPIGLASTLLAPLRAPEPALSSSTPGD